MTTSYSPNMQLGPADMGQEIGTGEAQYVQIPSKVARYSPGKVELKKKKT